MERVISQEERIRRAEEIYRRRRNQGVRVTGSTVSINDKKDFSLFRNLIIRICICSIIYATFYTIKNSNYIFSQGVLDKTNYILSYDMNIKKIYESGIELFNNFNIKEENQKAEEKNEGESTGKNEDVQEDENKEQKEDINNQKAEEIGEGESTEKNEDVQEDENKEQTSLQSVDGGVGGGNEIGEYDTQDIDENSQMEKDAIYIKERCSMIKPLNGIVTSGFGAREPSEIISANHAGIDIGADEGTKIVSAMDGVVSLVSQEGDYGNHIKITSGDITTVYAHCSNMYVKEGEEIKQGYEIADVGSTGRATGPHLHFEIRVEDRLVNPEYIMQF